MNKPSSTITFATLAGMGMTVIWGVVATFYPDLVLAPTLISGSTSFVAALVGYFKKEKVLQAKDLG